MLGSSRNRQASVWSPRLTSEAIVPGLLPHQKRAGARPYGDTIVEKIFIKWLFQVFNLQQMQPKLICLLGFAVRRCHSISLASWSGGNAAVKVPPPPCDSAGEEVAWGPEQPRWVGGGNGQEVQAGPGERALCSFWVSPTLPFPLPDAGFNLTRIINGLPQL